MAEFSILLEAFQKVDGLLDDRLILLVEHVEVKEGIYIQLAED